MSNPLPDPDPFERLAAVNQHLRRALDQMRDGSLILEAEPVTSPGPKIIFANAGAALLLGCGRETLLGGALGQILEPAVFGSFVASFDAQTQNGAQWQSEGKVKRADGSLLPVTWKVSALREASGKALNYFVTFAAHATPVSLNAHGEAPISLENPLIDSDPQSIPAPDEYQGDQVSNIRETSRRVAHEFNNALTAILMPVGMAARLATPGSDLLEKLILAQRSAQKAAGLAKDFLDCFRPRVAQKEPCELKELLSRTLRLATVAEMVDCQLNFTDDLLPVMADPEQMERVFFNLIRNACDAMNQHGRLLIKACNVDVPANLEQPSGQHLAPGSYVRVIVRDFGPGIPEEHMKHLFHSRFTTKPHGNGCGLPICYQIVSDHGGAMYVSSRLNIGTAFDIFLPTAVMPAPVAEPVTPPPVAAPELDPNFSPESVFASEAPVYFDAPPAPEPAPVASDRISSLLIVEDDDIIRMVTGDISKQLGWEVESAAAGDEALNILNSRNRQHRPIRAVLLDMNLRGPYNGLQTFERIQSLSPDTRVIATSGDHRDPEEYRRMGFVTFLPKPYSVESLHETLNEVLAR